MRIYNHDDALMYEERMRDYAAEDDEENRGQYEFPESRKGIAGVHPETLKRECPDWKMRDRELLRRSRNGKFSSWFEPVAAHPAPLAASSQAGAGIPRTRVLRRASLAIPACHLQRARRHHRLLR